jgi:hypothetical protein
MLQTETVEPDTLGLLKRLSRETALAHFVLVGGTALALQIGHRKSIDLDFFCPEPFDAHKLLSNLQDKYEIIAINIDDNTLIAEVNGVKVDFIRFRYPFKKPYLIEDGITLLDINDIAPMKIDAITGRGHKKDFFDLYFLLKHFSLADILDKYKTMFGHSIIFHVLKSLTYFDDAELNPNPLTMDKSISWPIIKKKIVEEVNFYTV